MELFLFLLLLLTIMSLMDESPAVGLVDPNNSDDCCEVVPAAVANPGNAGKSSF